MTTPTITKTAEIAYISTWRNTGNATEGTAAKHNHGLLCLDEIREANEKEIGTIIATQFNRLDDVAKRLIFEIINGLSRDRLTCAEVEAAEQRIRAGADKFSELENLVDLSNNRLVCMYDAAQSGEVAA